MFRGLTHKALIAGALLMGLTQTATAADLATRLTKISQALRGGKLPPAELVKQAEDDPSSVDVAAIVDEWLDSEEFYTNMDIWHKQAFRAPHLLNSDIEILDFAPPGLRESLAEEPVQYALFVLRNDLPYSSLLDSQLAIRNSMLEKFYKGEDPTGASTTDWHVVKRDSHESGVLTLRSMHLRNPTTVVNRWRTHANQVLEQWACQVMKPVDVAAEEDDAAHGTDPNCVSCHRPLDGAGTFFSRWDRFGNFDNSAGIDDRGAFYETINATHNGNGLVALGRILADSKRFAQCMVDKSWKMLSGRVMTDKEVKERSEFLRAFWQGDYNLKALLRAMVLSEAFSK